MSVIILDGLDAAGKGTAANYLNENIEDAILISFPRYDTPIGEEIKRRLYGHDPIYYLKRSLPELFKLDRREIYKEINKNPEKTYILDRSHISNIICHLHEGDSIGDLINLFLEEDSFVKDFSIPIIFHRKDEKSTKIHRKYLSTRTDKDIHETEEMQRIFDENIRRAADVIKLFDHNYFSIGIGEIEENGMEWFLNKLDEIHFEKFGEKLKIIGGI